MMRLYKWLIFILTITACGTADRTTVSSVVQFPNDYNPVNVKLHPAYTVYHNSIEISLLIVKIYPVELLYSGGIDSGQLAGQIKISYILNDLTDSENPFQADSGVYTYKIKREDSEKRFIRQIPIRAIRGKVYQLKVVAYDMVRKEENLTYLYVDKKTNGSEQNFMVVDAKGNVPYFQPYVLGEDVFKIRSLYTNSSKNIYVTYYGKDTPLPRPSFTQIRETEFFKQPDSTWVIHFDDEAAFQMKNEGIYHFRIDTTTTEGLTLANLGLSFPHVQLAEEMIEPLAYLTTDVEYEKLKSASNIKLNLDNFWLDKAGNAQRARELIRVYYNRVYYSNYYYSTSKPGWKTDRGMVFVIFGPPQSVTTTSDQEKWVYYKDDYKTKVTFVFNHIPTAYALNNYVLQPSINFDTYWRETVNTWRKGNIYVID